MAVANAVCFPRHSTSSQGVDRPHAHARANVIKTKRPHSVCRATSRTGQGNSSPSKPWGDGVLRHSSKSVGSTMNGQGVGRKVAMLCADNVQGPKRVGMPACGGDPMRPAAEGRGRAGRRECRSGPRRLRAKVRCCRGQFVCVTAASTAIGRAMHGGSDRGVTVAVPGCLRVTGGYGQSDENPARGGEGGFSCHGQRWEERERELAVSIARQFLSLSCYLVPLAAPPICQMC